MMMMMKGFSVTLAQDRSIQKKRRGQVSKNKSERTAQAFRDKTRKAKAQNETSKITRNNPVITRNNSVRTINRMRKIKGGIGLLLNGE